MPAQTIIAPPSTAALFLVFTIDETAPEAIDTVRDLFTDFPGLNRTVSFRYPDANLYGVIGIGARLWPLITSAPIPEQLHEFREIRGAKHSAPSTPGDLILHLRAASVDMCWELARIVMDRLANVATVVDETHGFKFFDNRDLLGFVDGTENPENSDAEDAVRISAPSNSPYINGSYLIVQKYLHDMNAWKELNTEEQEKVIGRTKLDNVELDDATKPNNSHVAINDVDSDIYRLNMPFGSFKEQEFGTYFAGYSGDVSVTEEMLTNMFVGKPTGNYDRILDFSYPTTGTLFFIPSIELLDDFAEQLPAPTAE